MLFEKDVFNIKSLLAIILNSTNKSTKFLADSYLLKHHSAVSRWCNNKAVPNIDDLSNIVKFAVNESTAIQRKLILEQVEALINKSILDEDIRASLLVIEDYSSFLLECLKVCTCRLSNYLNSYSLDKSEEKSVSNDILNNTSIMNGIFISLPIKPTKNFVARENELEKLKKIISNKNATLLVNGLGGIGKTELCRKYFWDNKDAYAFAGWINYTNNLKESFVNQISFEGLKFNKSTSLDNKYSKVIMLLNKLPANSLLVIDNLEANKEDDINSLISLPIKILATSRENFEAFTTCSVDALDEKACIDLFYKYFNGKKDDENLCKIISLAGNHTLTIELLAKTANNAAMEIKELCEKLEHHGFDLSKEIIETIDTSWKELKENRFFFEHLLAVFSLSNLNENEKYVLANMSILPSTYINIRDLRQWLDLPSNDDINSLIKKGWLKQEGFSVNMHRIIQAIVRHELNPTYDKCIKLISSLNDCLQAPPGSGYNLIDKKKYIPFAESLLEFVYESNEIIASLCNRISIFYLFDSKYKKALKYEYKAYKIRKDIFGKNHIQTAKSYSQFFKIFYSRGKFDIALAYVLKETDINRLQFGEDSLQVCFSYGNLSSCYNVKGNYDSAMKYLIRSFEISSKLFEKNHPVNITTYNNMGNIYRNKGDLKQAESYTLLALQTQLENSKDNSQSTARYYCNLSFIYYQQGNFDSAFKNQIKALIILKAMFKEDHADIAKSYSCFSILYTELGKLEKALRYQFKALNILKKIVDENSFLLAECYCNLSVIYLKIGNFQKSHEYQLLAIKIYNKTFGDEHTALLKCYDNLSMIYKGLKKYNVALENQLKVIEIRKTKISESHLDCIYSYYNLSTIYLEIKDNDNAYAYAQKAFDILNLLDFGILYENEIIQNYNYIKEMQVNKKMG